MCDTRTLVPIPDFLWESGEVVGFDSEHPEYGLDDQGRRCLRLDDCIIPAIQALWAIGVVTLACCCGHSDGTNGVITLRTVAAKHRIGTMLVRVEEYDRLRVAERLANAVLAKDELVVNGPVPGDCAPERMRAHEQRMGEVRRDFMKAFVEWR